MPDLIVTSAALEDSAAKLTSIKAELDHAHDKVREDKSVWAQSDLTAAMANFAYNWDIHRGKIAAAVGDLQKKMQDMTQAWEATEQDLADGLTTQTQ